MHVPTRASAVLSRRSPVRGSVAAADAAAAFLQDVIDDCWGYAAQLAVAEHDLAMCSAVSVDALIAKLGGNLRPGAAVLRESAEKARRGFTRYAAEVDRIHECADQAQGRIDEELATIRVQSGVVEDILVQIGRQLELVWDDPPAASLPEPRLDAAHSGDMDAEARASARENLAAQHEEQWRLAVAAWGEACVDIVTECENWEELIADRESAERALLNTLGDTRLGRLIALGSVRGGRGPKRTIANAVSGEIWGERISADELTRVHPALQGLFPPHGDGAGAWDSPPDPDAVAAWWGGLDDRSKDQLITEAPWVIGNLPGLPFSVRDAANRLVLDYYLANRASLSTACQDGLDAIVRAAGADNGRPQVSIVALDLSGEVPLTAMGYGPLDDAENLNWEVPGMNNDVPDGLPGWDRASRNLYAQQLKQLREAGRAGESTGLIVFMEYDTPNPATVLSAETARTAAGRLASELDGTAATRAMHTPLPRLGVIAHSYGTTVAAIALLSTKRPVQSFTMVASAGIDGDRVKSLTQLNVDRDAAGKAKVYTTMASKDWLAPFGSKASGRKQPNPQVAWSSDEWIDGASSFSSDGHGALRPTTGHSTVQTDGQGYFDPLTQSLKSLAALSIGETRRVPGGVKSAERPESTVFDDMAERGHLGGRR